MTPAEFKQYAMTYGAALARWPEPLRGEAEILLAASPELADALVSQAPLDAALAAQAPAVSGARLRALERRILDGTRDAPAFAARLREWFTPRELTPLAAGVILALIIGWATREARPPEEVLAANEPDNAVLALLEFDASGLGVL